ncbi:MAG TPA: tetratricopeptide repeat protein [Longimicrobiales bacterium]
MVHTRSNRQLTLILALGLMAGGLVLASPAAAQERFRVLVPKSLAREGDVDDDFGEDVTDELRKLIDELPTHTPVDKDEIKAALKQYKLDDDDLMNCITARQLAAQRGYELVLCGSYAAAPGGFEVKAKFVSPRENQEFNVDAFTVAEKGQKEAAQHIFESFNNYIQLLSYSRFCMDHLASRQWNEALQRCDAALAIDENAEMALYGRGYALMQLNQDEEAMAALTRVLERNPIHQEALMAAGFLAARMGNVEESRKYYRQYLELNPGAAEIRLTIANDAAKAGDPAGALQVVEAGIQGDSADVTLLEYAAYFAMAAGAKAEEAANAGGNGAAAAPDTAAAAAADTTANAETDAAGFYQKALDYFDRVLATQPESLQPNFTVSYVNALVRLGRAEEAVARGAEFLAKQPENAPLWSIYAAALNEAGRLDEALAALDTVMAKDTTATGVRSRKAQWLLEAGQVDAAKEAFAAAVAAGELTGDQAARAFLSIGVSDKYQKKEYDAALPYLRAAVDLAVEPQSKGMAHFFIGYILYVQAEQVQAPGTAASARKALPMFQEALEHLRLAKPYGDANPSLAASLQQLVNGAQQYIERQEALIKRGR